MTHLRPVLPHALTFASLFCGMGAIAMAMEGQVGYAGGLILVGYVLDALDGELARRLAVTSEFGLHLDSLSDTVIFGAATAVLVRGHLRGTAMDGAWVWIFGLAYVAAGVYRLARYNLQMATEKDPETLGLTISTSGALVTLMVLTDRVYEGQLFPDWAFAAVLGLAALLMASRVRFPELRVVLFNRWLNLALLGAVVTVSIFLSVQLVGLTLAAGYITFGLVRAGLRIL